MNRTAIPIAIFAFFLSISASAQEPAGASHVYEAYYRVAYSDLDEWNELYFSNSVPILNALQAEGIIEGYNEWVHHSGGTYNIRFVARTYDWSAIETFWAEYISRLEASMSPAQWARANAMILEHRDEIWDIGEVNVPEEFEATHIYTALFNVNFGNMDEWNAIWASYVNPIFEQAMEDGLLGGWVRLDHNTGGPYDSKYLIMVDGWDKLDDVIFDRMIGTLVEEHPEQWARVNELFSQHTDIIWEPATPED